MISKIWANFLPSLIILTMSFSSYANDGYDLWLGYKPLDKPKLSAAKRGLSGVQIPGQASAITQRALKELQLGLGSMLGKTVTVNPRSWRNNIVISTPQNLPEINDLTLPLKQLGNEGFLIKRVKLQGKPVTLITANEDIGLLYGTFELLKQLRLGHELNAINISSAPKIQRRVLNHWDNLDRTVERGYAGQSLWDWWRLPDFLDPRYTDYARANASLGINGTVLNNVNANSTSLTRPFLKKAAALADVFRPFGIKVYLSARFSSPIEIGGLPTADPLDPQVQQWWKAKTEQIYQVIPDFGGFLVKANSEGQPGPGDYQRSHAQGANMLADALSPFGGIVMWRAFVYSEHDADDRAKQAYNEFKPLDGKFADNVVLQVKNGAIDFQPREPFHPMFGAFPHTPLAMEFQITKEYLGFDTHLAYLGPLYEEVLQADTYGNGQGSNFASNVASVIDGSLHGHQLSAIAGVANIGTDRDWTGSIFNQANWYVFGKMAWNPNSRSADIAKEWLTLTFNQDPHFIETAAEMMMQSREAVVNYMTPLGLAHLMGTDHHYGPAPWVDNLGRPEWNPAYYHQANEKGIGFDRTINGSNAIAQYAPRVAELFADPEKIDERFLLWFHHLPWDFELRSGDTLWHSLVTHYDQGLQSITNMQTTWESLKPYVDAERFNKTASLLAIQQREAQWWRDASIAYFQDISGLPLPAGVAKPSQSLEFYKAQQHPFAPGN